MTDRSILGIWSRPWGSLLLAVSILVAAMVSGPATGQSFHSFADRSNSRVIGGADARPGQFPYQVFLYISLSEELGSSCGGSVIDRQWVLTAAHCVTDDSGRVYDANQLYLFIGVTDTSDPNQLPITLAKSVIVHPNWQGDIGISEDIALIQLANPTSAPALKLSTYSTDQELLAPGTPATISGFGYVGYDHGQDTPERTNQLQFANIKVIAPDRCARVYRGASATIMDGDLFCAGLERGGDVGSCAGDSGGPLVAQLSSGERRQIGLVSFGRGPCSTEETFGVYVAVSTHIDWIERNTGLSLDEDAGQDPIVGDGGAGDRVLLVGIDQYQVNSLSFEWPASETDVSNMRKLLINTFGFKSEQIKTLVNEEATSANIKKALQDWLIEGSQPGARVWFYFSGHGYFQPDTNGDEDDGRDEVLVAHDTQILDDGSGILLLENEISDDVLAEVFLQLEDRRAVAVIDSCHSGTATRSLSLANRAYSSSVRSAGPRLRAATRGLSSRSLPAFRSVPTEGFTEGSRSLITWTAVSPRQEALVAPDLRPPQGLFTNYFVRGVGNGLADSNRDGRITHAELLHFVRQQSKKYCDSKAACNLGLTPMLEGPQGTLASDVITGELSGDDKDEIEDTLNPADGTPSFNISILPSSQLHDGDRLQIQVASNRRGNLLLLDVNSEGQATQIFPNLISERNNPDRILAQTQRIVIPNASYGFQFHAGAPYGEGMVIGILTEDPIDLEDLVRENTQFNSIADPLSFVDEIAERLNQPIEYGDGARAPNVLVTRATYYVSQ